MDITSRDVEGVLQRELSNIDIACLIAKLDSFSVFVGCSLCDNPSSIGLSLSRLRNIIISFIMTHDCSFGHITPDLTFILNLSETIDKTIVNLDRIGLKDTTHGSNRIQYIQSEITEILPKVALIPISSFCQFAERDIKDELNIDASELLDFANKIYWENLFPRYEKPVSLEIVDKDYDKEPFRNRLRVESINIPESMFPPVGSFPNDEFDANSPISVINKHHCIGFSIGKEKYVFSREAVPGLFVDSVVQAMSEKPNFKERAFKIKSDWAESVVKSIFCEIFGEQSYLGNNYIGPKGKRFENDGLLEYGSMLFPIEVKSFRFNPDPVGTTETTETSFAESVSKPIQQCDRFYNEVMKEDNLLIFDSEGTLKKTVSTSDIKAIIPICVFSSEVGTYVAQRQISISNKDYGNPILISVWDLLMVLNYLQKPVLIAKYLFERSGKIVEKRIRTDDELTFLGIFCDCLSLSSSLNSISTGEVKEKISDIYLDTASFSHDIEMFYSNSEEKKPFKALTPLMNSVINEIDRSDDPLVQEAGIIFLSLPKEDLCQLENRLKNKKNSNVIEPSGIRSVLTNGSQLSMCFFATNFDRSYAVAFSYVYFQKNQSIADVVSFFPLDTSLPTPIAIKRSFPFLLDSKAMAIAQKIIGFTTIKHL